MRTYFRLTGFRKLEKIGLHRLLKAEVNGASRGNGLGVCPFLYFMTGKLDVGDPLLSAMVADCNVQGDELLRLRDETNLQRGNT